MDRQSIRSAARTFLRDVGIAKHWTDAQLNDWGALVLRSAQQRIVRANPDWYRREVLIATDGNGQFDFDTFPLDFKFSRPLSLTAKQTLTDTSGTPYHIIRSRFQAQHQQPRTGFIEGASQVLTVHPREARNFALEYVYRPKGWDALAEGDTPDFPEEFHPYLGCELAVAALTGGGREDPGPLGGIVGELRQEFDTFLQRFDETGPMQTEATDDALDWGSA